MREQRRDGGGEAENRIAREVVDAALKIHRALGPGMLESAYESALVHELQRRGVKTRSQVAIDIRYEGLLIEGGFRADVIADGRVLVELKSVVQTLPVHRKQTLTYLRFTGLRLGLLLNFGAPRMKDGITRLVNGF